MYPKPCLHSSLQKGWVVEQHDAMSPEMVQAIEQILETVREPESDLSVKDLGLVKKVTYSRNYSRIIVKTSFTSPRRTCMLCGIITATVQRTIMRELEEQFTRRFPDLIITVE